MTTITELARLAQEVIGIGDPEDWERYIAAADPQTILGLVREIAEFRAKIDKAV